MSEGKEVGKIPVSERGKPPAQVHCCREVTPTCSCFSPGKSHLLVIRYVLFKLIQCNYFFVYCLFSCTLTSIYRWIEPRKSTSLPLGEVPKCHTKSLYFAPGKLEAGTRYVCSDCGCLGVGWGPWGPGRQDAGPPKWCGREPWWRLKFPALGLGLSSCFLLIEQLDNAIVTQLPASWVNNNKFVQGQLGSGGCTSHLLPGSQVGGASGTLNSFPACSLCPKVLSWLVDFRLSLFGFSKLVLAPLYTADPELLWLHADQLSVCHPSQALPDLLYSSFEVQWVWHSPWRFWVSYPGIQDLDELQKDSCMIL